MSMPPPFRTGLYVASTRIARRTFAAAVPTCGSPPTGDRPQSCSSRPRYRGGHGCHPALRRERARRDPRRRERGGGVGDPLLPAQRLRARERGGEGRAPAPLLDDPGAPDRDLRRAHTRGLTPNETATEVQRPAFGL